MDLDPGRALVNEPRRLSTFIATYGFAGYQSAVFPMYEEGQPLQLSNVSGLNTFTCVMAWFLLSPLVSAIWRYKGASLLHTCYY